MEIISVKSNRVISRNEAQALDLSMRIALERRLTDAAGEEKYHAGGSLDESLRSYRTRSPWRALMFGHLGECAGRTVVDLGCGYNPTPLLFALWGGTRVYACDVSPKAVAFQMAQAKAAGVGDQVMGVVCAGERLPFPDGEIDLIHGEAVLHHLQLRLAGCEIARVLRGGGKGAFKDPLGQNPLLEFARDYLPYPEKPSAKGTDHPLCFEDIEHFGVAFGRCEYHGFGLTSMLARFVAGRRDSRLHHLLHRADSSLLRRWVWLERFCRFVVTCVAK